VQSTGREETELAGLFNGIEAWAVGVVESLGYSGIFALTVLETIVPPIPSEMILPLAGFQVVAGRFTYPLVVLAATAGSVVGALVLYGLGYWFGSVRLRTFVERLERFTLVGADDLDRAYAWFERHGAKAVFLGRLVPGVRSVISLPAGVSRMGLPRFVLLTALGSAIWNGVLVGLGWLLGERWGTVGGTVSYVQYGVVIGVICLVGWFVGSRFLTSRLARRRNI
jgi:membrane protein DedA with SNARE-associated domain